MAEFLKSNGRFGPELCFHTATGYQCVANHPGNHKGYSDRIMFFARHVVGGDGRPYTEVGLMGLEDNEHEQTKLDMKRTLDMHGFHEVVSLSEHVDEDMVYAEHSSADPESVAIRLNAGQVSLSKAVEVLGKWVLESSREFVVEQEQVPDVLFHSIMSEMGEEMEKGPGGAVHAKQKALQLAEALEHGCWSA